MSSLLQLCKNVLRLSGLAVLFAVPSFATGIAATASYTAVADPTTAGLYDYTLTLNNTGTTTIGTFWFGWIPGGNFLNPKPINVTQPAGWVDSIISVTQGNSIQYTTTTNLLQAGQSLSGFGFQSTETPAQLLGVVPSGTGAGDPITTAFVYIAAPRADPGAQITVAPTPEPSSFVLLATGLAGVTGTLYRRSKAKRTA